MKNFFSEFEDLANVPVIRLKDSDPSKHRIKEIRNFSISLAVEAISLKGDWCEFGVYRGETARELLKYLPGDSKLYLFDSFEGLPEDWSGRFKKGYFKLDEDQIPRFSDPRIVVKKGIYSSVERDYFKSSNSVAFSHIDCDLKSSTIDALNIMRPALRIGTIILFDEFLHSLDGKIISDEYEAWKYWTRMEGVEFRYLFRTEWSQCAIEVTSMPTYGFSSGNVL
jgi:hypothetical protein